MSPSTSIPPPQGMHSPNTAEGGPLTIAHQPSHACFTPFKSAPLGHWLTIADRPAMTVATTQVSLF